MQHEDKERAGWLRLSVPVPPRLAELIGYRGEARWVAFHWEPCGDESFYDDGRTSGTGSPWAYLAYVRHRAVAGSLAPFNLGSSDSEASEWLVLDRAEQVLYVAPAQIARRFLVRQHPPLPQPPLAVGQATESILADLLDLSRWREVQIDPAAVERAMREEQQATAAMVAFLDEHLE
jgi:hypothetical protein